MFLTLITMYPSLKNEAKIVEVLDSMKGPIATNADCQGILSLVDDGPVRSVCYMERWRTRAAMERHLRSALFCRVLEAMELSRTPPVVEFFDATAIGGLELVQKVRLCGPDDVEKGRG
ncbi:MAG: hypothetical protein RBT36_08505 [Desulfobulbus sp.]|jgi:quinol monooxygenase YgiN|nr:hypothetical protein [Desulfobulbus sp.]